MQLLIVFGTLENMAEETGVRFVFLFYWIIYDFRKFLFVNRQLSINLQLLDPILKQMETRIIWNFYLVVII